MLSIILLSYDVLRQFYTPYINKYVKITIYLTTAEVAVFWCDIANAVAPSRSLKRPTTQFHNPGHELQNLGSGRFQQDSSNDLIHHSHSIYYDLYYKYKQDQMLKLYFYNNFLLNLVKMKVLSYDRATHLQSHPYSGQNGLLRIN